jgi:hypothetical protein
VREREGRGLLWQVREREGHGLLWQVRGREGRGLLWQVRGREGRCLLWQVRGREGRGLLWQVGSETILHMCCRDRNLLGLLSDLLGNHSRGLHNMVVITGVTTRHHATRHTRHDTTPPDTMG